MGLQCSGKVVVITGATGGLGTAICLRYAREGANIAALDLDPLQLDELAKGLSGLGCNILPVVCDVTDSEAVRVAVSSIVQAFGGIDVIINNAGITHRSLLADTDPGVIRKVMEVNFFGALNLTHSALPHLKVRNGSIAAISSVAGFAPLVGRTGYAASKHALHGFFDSLRSELSQAEVSVTLVCPSFIATGIGAAALGSGLDGNASGPRITTGGESTPEEIAERIVMAIARRQALLLPDTTSRLAWWYSRLLPAAYASTMKKRVGSEFNL
jgi:NAD(P)-dependent dehydrogenase (short-subunit alcohol dehydrogenase family)